LEAPVLVCAWPQVKSDHSSGLPRRFAETVWLPASNDPDELVARSRGDIAWGRLSPFQPRRNSRKTRQQRSDLGGVDG